MVNVYFMLIWNMPGAIVYLQVKNNYEIKF